jgi:hypothetical protein
MKFLNADEHPCEGGTHTDEQMKAHMRAEHQFAINRSTSARRRAENPLEGGKCRHT